MNEFESLRQQAKARRDAAIVQAKQDYGQTLSQIDKLQRSMKPVRPQRDSLGHGNKLTLRQAIVTVLGDRKLLKIEIVLGVLQLGYKSSMPRKELIKSVNAILRKDARFWRAGDKWTMVG